MGIISLIYSIKKWMEEIVITIPPKKGILKDRKYI